MNFPNLVRDRNLFKASQIIPIWILNVLVCFIWANIYQPSIVTTNTIALTGNIPITVTTATTNTTTTIVTSVQYNHLQYTQPKDRFYCLSVRLLILFIVGPAITKFIVCIIVFALDIWITNSAKKTAPETPFHFKSTRHYLTKSFILHRLIYLVTLLNQIPTCDAVVWSRPTTHSESSDPILSSSWNSLSNPLNPTLHLVDKSADVRTDVASKHRFPRSIESQESDIDSAYPLPAVQLDAQAISLGTTNSSDSTDAYRSVLILSITICTIICVLFLIILVFWCSYQKQSRKNVVGMVESSPEHGDTNASNFSPTIDPTTSNSGSNITKHTRSTSNTQGLRTTTPISTRLISLVPYLTDCCRLFCPVTDSNDKLTTPGYDSKKPDFHSPSTKSGSPSSVEPRNSVAKEDSRQPDSLPVVLKLEPSISPSLATRRHQVPPPPLLTTQLSSMVSTIETQSFLVQPPDYTMMQTYYGTSIIPEQGDLGMFTESLIQTSPVTSSGSLTTSTSGGGTSSSNGCSKSSIRPCSATLGRIVQSQDEHDANPRLPGLVGETIQKSAAHVVLRSSAFLNETTQAVTTCSSAAGAAPKSYPGISSTPTFRGRTKGLLESRRGSRTSLTLSLSPSVDSPMVTCSIGSAQLATLGGSLDEGTCAMEDSSGHALSPFFPSPMCEHQPHQLEETPCSPTPATDEPPNSEECLATSVMVCDLPHPDTESSSTTASLTADSEPRRRRSALDDGAASTVTVPSGTADSGSSATSAASKRVSPLVISSMKRDQSGPLVHRHHMCHHHHHHHHHRHHHFYYAGHHCRPDLGLPCSMGNLVCQRSRDLEQLLNASLPLTPDQLETKLKDNACALFQEFWDIPMNHADKKELPIPGIGNKNRYQSILPNFATRVILPTTNNDLASSYINANYIRGYDDRPNSFIATQGPMPHTVVDFWRMVWHSHAPAIVMITKLVENREVKCELYLPTEPAGDCSARTDLTSASPRASSSSCTSSPPSSTSMSVFYSELSGSPFGQSSASHISSSFSSQVTDSGIHCLDSQRIENRQKLVVDPNTNFYHLVSLPGCVKTFSDITVRVLSLDHHDGFYVRRLKLQCNGEEREVIHLWYLAWPDHSSPETTPASARSLLQLVRAVEHCRRTTDSHQSPKSEQPELSSMPQQSSDQPDPPPTAATTERVEDTDSLKASLHLLGAHKYRIPCPLTPFAPNLPSNSKRVSLECKEHQVEGPIIVHCSAGLGRTGCFIALCIGCEQFRREGLVDVLRIVSRLRLDRGGMVQSNEQYEFIHHALAVYAAMFKPGSHGNAGGAPVIGVGGARDDVTGISSTKEGPNSSVIKQDPAN